MIQVYVYYPLLACYSLARQWIVLPSRLDFTAVLLYALRET